MTVGDTGSNLEALNAGDTVVFTLVVSNDGMGTATNVTLTDVLPAGVTWTEDSEFAEIIDGVLVANFGDLASGESVTIHITGVLGEDACGSLCNAAFVSADNEELEDQVDNRGAACILVNPVLTQSDLDFLTTQSISADALAAYFALAAQDDDHNG
jgi:uncharacterized repeat protein (TIGR01451 family)